MTARRRRGIVEGMRTMIAALVLTLGCSSTGVGTGSDGGVDLAGVDLAGADFSGVDLAGVDLAGGGCLMTCAAYELCCAGRCVYPQNDPFNCNQCGNVCGGPHPYCNNGSCATTPPCASGMACFTGFCCGSTCCNDGQLCCEVPGPGPSSAPSCYTPTPSQPTCPIGCPLCG
jgi:hypothetical protein